MMTEDTVLDTAKLDANQAAAEMDSTQPTEPATCPLTADTVQLIPIRYALVENTQQTPNNTATKTLLGDHKMQSHSIGYRIMRDGWLYIVDSHDKRIYEYSLAAGIVRQRTYKGGYMEPASRTTYHKIYQGSAKDKALIFKKNSILYFAFSEIQWTDEKCNQAREAPERETFLQAVDLREVDCSYQSQHLLTKERAEKEIAEFVQQTPHTPSGYTPIFETESQPFSWEDKNTTEYKQETIGKLTQQVMPEHKNGNYLFVAVEDYIGMMLDLANEQELVIKWMDKWADKMDQQGDNFLKYSIANYIDSTLEITETNVANKGITPWMAGLTPEQRQTIYDYITIKIETEYKAGFKWTLKLPEGSDIYKMTREELESYMVVADWYIELEQELAQKKQTMLAAITEPIYNDHKDEIETLKDNQLRYLYGSLWGHRGVNKLTNLNEMQKYLKVEKARMQQWSDRLDRISEDRCYLYTNKFHRATWYFDNAQLEQFKAALKVEIACTKDLLRTDALITKLADFFDKYPQYLFPAFQTNFSASNYLTPAIKGIIDYKGDLVDIIKGNPSAEQRMKEALGESYMRMFTSDDVDILSLEKTIQTNINPAVQQGLMGLLDEMRKQQFSPEQQNTVINSLQQLEKIIGQLKPRQRTAFLIAIQKQGFIITTQNPSDLTKIYQLFEEIGTTSVTINNLHRDINKLMREVKRINRLKTKFAPNWREIRDQKNVDIETKKQQIAGLSNDIISAEQEIQKSTSPLREGEVMFGFRGRGLTSQQSQLVALEQSMLNKGVLRGYGISGSAAKAFNSAWLPAVLFYFQWNNLYSTAKEYSNNSINILPVIASTTGTLSSALGIVQAMYVGITNHAITHIKKIDSAAGIQLATRLGRFSLIVGSAAQLLGLPASMLNIYLNQSRWIDSIYYGDASTKASAAAQLTLSYASAGVSGIGVRHSVVQGYGLWRDLRGVNQAYGAARSVALAGQAREAYTAARAAVWALRGAQFTTALARLTPVGIGLTILQIVGEYAYNYYNLSEMQQWLHKGCWGRDIQGWTEEEHNRYLANVLLKPWIEDHGTIEENGQYWRVLRLNVPGQDMSTLSERSIAWQAVWRDGIPYNPSFTKRAIGMAFFPYGAWQSSEMINQALSTPDTHHLGTYLQQNTQIVQAMGPMILEWRLPWLSQQEWDDSQQGVLTINLIHESDLAPDFPVEAHNNGLEYRLVFDSWDIPNKQQAVIIQGKEESKETTISKFSMYYGDISYGE